MAITLEQVEKLREKADVSYEEAKRALEEAGGDLLEALIRLERQGKTRSGGQKGAYYTTRPAAEEEITQLVSVPTPPKGGRGKQARAEGGRPGFWGQLKELLLAGLNLLRHCTLNQFEVWRAGQMMTSLPVLILILLVVVAFWISIPLLILGLFFGCRYRFSGPDLDENKVGEVANSVSSTISGVVDQVKEEFQKAAGKKKD